MRNKIKMSNKKEGTKLNEEEIKDGTAQQAEAGDNKEQTFSAEGEDKLFAAVRQSEEYRSLVQRVQADFDNYRKRNVESVRTARAEGNNDVIAGLLPVADAVDRALSMITDEKSREGVALIQKQMDTLLAKYGVCEMKASGDSFDPELHNAILQTEDAENAGKVVEVLQKGYLRDGKVLRHAMVKVAK